MIIDAALGHVGERGPDDGAVGVATGAPIGPPQQGQIGRLGKFRRPLHAARNRVHHGQGALRRLVDLAQRSEAGLAPGDAADQGDGGLFEAFGDGLDVLIDPVPLGFIEVGDSRQNIAKSRLAVARRGGKIGATPKGLALRSQKHSHRPAAAGAGGDQGLHINGVDVRPFFPVHFDVDEQLVHDRGGFRRFKTFVGHDMAPVTGRITDGQQDRFIFRPCFLQRPFSPGQPMDRVVFMLQQIGTGFLMEFVGGHGTILLIGVRLFYCMKGATDIDICLMAAAPD